MEPPSAHGPPRKRGGHRLAQRSGDASALQAKILEALLPMLGHPRHVAAAVTVELESATVTRSEKAYDPNSGVPISVDFREEKSTDGAPARGVPGALKR